MYFITDLPTRIEWSDVVQISLLIGNGNTNPPFRFLDETFTNLLLPLYTLEAWTSFLTHLSPRGLLSVSRWYYADRPGEVYRSAALAATTPRTNSSYGRLRARLSFSQL